MELFFLLHDQDGVIHKEFQFEFDDQATLNQLKEEIRSTWNINKKYQLLFLEDGRKITGFGSDGVFSLGLKHGDKLIVKHAELSSWSTYRDCVEAVTNSPDNRVEYAKASVELYKQLMESGFFIAYPSFNDYRLKRQAEVAAWADGDLEMMAKAAKNHFYIQHGRRGGTSEADFKFSYGPRSEGMRGSRRGIIVDVQLHGEEQPVRYSIKCHHFGSNAFSFKGSPPDIIEFFCYKLLELIKVGPAVQFIFPAEQTGSKTAAYIATKWRNEFVRLSDISNESDFNIEALVQLRVLNVLLFIDDLGVENCGQWSGTRQAAVVDFMPVPYGKYASVKKEMVGLGRLKWNNVPLKLLAKCRREEFWSIAGRCLQEWNLLGEIERATEFIVKEKNQMKALAMDFRAVDESLEIDFRGTDDESKHTVTNDLENYLEAIKSNVETLLNELKQNE